MESKNEPLMYPIIQSKTKRETYLGCHKPRCKLGCVNNSGLSANYKWNKSLSYIGNDHQRPHNLID